MEVRLANFMDTYGRKRSVGATFGITFEGRLNKQRSRLLRTYILWAIFGVRSAYVRLSISARWNT